MLNDTPVRSTLPPVQARSVPSVADANRLEAQVASPEPWAAFTPCVLDSGLDRDR